jgi:hypothetical protein
MGPPAHVDDLRLTAQPLQVVAEAGSATSWGRPSERSWLVRLWRAERSVVIAAGMTGPTACHLARRVGELLGAG